MGAVCVTYCVGGLEPVQLASPGRMPRSRRWSSSAARRGCGSGVNNPLLHHKVRDFRTQFEVFEKLCVAGTELDDPLTAFREIDRVLDAAARYKRPVYIEIPRDMVDVVPEHAAPVSAGRRRRAIRRRLAEAVDEAERWISSCQRPMIMAGVEIHRFGLQDELLALAEGRRFPIATTMLGKSVIPRDAPALRRPLRRGDGPRRGHAVRRGERLRAAARRVHDRHQPRHLHRQARPRQVHLRHERAAAHPPPSLSTTCGSTTSSASWPHRQTRQRAKRAMPHDFDLGNAKFVLKPDEPITIARLIARLNELLDDETIVIADIGDSLFAATELVMRGRTEFISPAYYTSMGFSVPAALGAQCGAPRLAGAGDRRRRRVPDDRHGALDDRPPRLLDDRDRARQPRLRHRALPAPGRASTTSIPGSITSCRKSSAAARVTKSAPKANSTRP